MGREFIFDKFHTWLDWQLILTAKSVTPPEVKTYYVDIDGRSGSLDLSEALTGEISYQDRTVSASFWTDTGTYVERSALIRDIVTILHGKKIQIIEPDDPAHYFYGRVSIKETSNILPYATIELEATCEPWRYHRNVTVRRVDVNSSDITEAVISNNGGKTLCPEITVTGNIKLHYNGSEIPLAKGTYKIREIRLKSGVNLIGVSGAGSVSFLYREADI